LWCWWKMEQGITCMQLLQQVTAVWRAACDGTGRCRDQRLQTHSPAF
jgi:hypothetical protein